MAKQSSLVEDAPSQSSQANVQEEFKQTAYTSCTELSIIHMAITNWNDPLGDSGVYNMRDKENKPLLRDAVMEELKRKKQFLTWFFPVDT
ncbi:unnamed protein product [Urochloa humidicola]